MTDSKKTALITGANKGIGREIARRLAEDGYTVWLGCRDADRGEAAAEALRQAGGDVRFVALDVTDEASVKSAAATVAGASDKLDVLVNNAGIAPEYGAGSGPTSMETLLDTYAVNVFGPVRVTRAFLPALKAAPAARIVNMSSGLGSLAQQSDPANPFYGSGLMAYNSSKTALNAITVAFAKELKDTPIKVNAACPGYTATDLNDNSGPRTVEQGAEIALRLAALGADGPTGGYFNDDGPIPW